jgi:hypothetical protein
MSPTIHSSLAPNISGATKHNTRKTQIPAKITLNDTSIKPAIPANSRITNKRYTKNRNTHTEYLKQNVNDGSSLDYSSSTSSSSTNRKLRPSSSIYPKTNAKNRKQAPTRITKDWAKIFPNSKATHETNTSTSIDKNRRTTTATGGEQGHITIRGNVQTKIHTQNSYHTTTRRSSDIDIRSSPKTPLEDKSISEEGTPFTIPPLDKINWQANSIEAREILNGSIPTTFLSDNPYVNKVLKYMADRPNLPEIDTYIMKEQVAQGFKRRQTKETPSANSETDSQRAHGIQTISAIYVT